MTTDIPQAAPALLGQAIFKPDFTPFPGAEQTLSAEEVGPVLGTLARIAGMLGTTLKAGSIKALVSWGYGQGLAMRWQRDRVEYEAWDGITCWEEADPELRGEKRQRTLESGWPLFPSPGEWVDLLKEVRAVDWFALRPANTSTWQETVKGVIMNRRAISQAALQLFQINLILNTQQYPRGRLAVTFENHRLWLWNNGKGDFLAVCSARVPNAFPLIQIAHLGECFFLRE